MKKTNKYLSLLLALVMIFSMMPFAALEASAADIPVVSLKSSSDTVDVGDTITLTITTTPSSKIISFGANITYDSEYFEVIPDSESYASGLFGDMNANKAGVVKVAFVVGSQTVGDSVTDLFTIDFKVLKANGTFDLDILEVYILDGTSQKKVTSSVNEAVQPIVIVCNHTYTLVNSSNATCTQDGYKKYVCSKCNVEYTETIAAGHTLVNMSAKAPTCTETGYEAYEYCTVCDYTTYKEIPSNGHNYEPTVTAPTCIEDGYTTYTCSLCDDTYTADVVSALGHTPKDAVEEKYVAPTCTDAGSVENVVYCAACDVEISREKETIPVIPHKAGDVVVENKSDASCGTPGSYDEVIYCVDCGFELSRNSKTTETLPHSYISRITTTPTCTEKGIKTITCTVCGDSYTEALPETGHTIINVEAKEPTCTETGYEAYEYCSVCDYTTYKEIVANGHTNSDAVEENYLAPTCTENGSKDVVVYCSECDEEISRETVGIEATGHADNDGDGYCDADNELLDPSVECECNCHKTGISKFFFKLILFFQRLFGSNKVCACGIAHY